ncbi:MAG: dienelactone hydrolase family protein [Bradyrhizobium sp.]|nr:dienelactone hydrolase family protein [Bradyrhizobium sp.]
MRSVSAIAAAVTLMTSMAISTPGRTQASPTDHPALLEETTFLDIRAPEGNYRLEALIVRLAAAKGRLPVALLTHGKPRLPSELVKMRAALMSPQARDLAYRGYLAVAVVRRGYGVSGGTPGQPANAAYAKCNDADLRRYFALESDDLERALRVVAGRADADAAQMIALGASVGGGAVLALAARNPPGLKAAVNFAGAMRITDTQGELSCPQEMPIAALASFGSRTKTPTLWVYSENDSNFGPDAARKTYAAYVAQGGVATLKMVSSLQPGDGHNVFELPAGRQHWLAALDPFLRAQSLPTWSAQQVDTLMQRYNITANRRQWLEGYFSLYTPKVLVRSPGGVLNYSASTSGIEPSQKAALEGCEKTAKAPCQPIMKNFDIVATPN